MGEEGKIIIYRTRVNRRLCYSTIIEQTTRNSNPGRLSGHLQNMMTPNDEFISIDSGNYGSQIVYPDKEILLACRGIGKKLKFIKQNKMI